MSKNHKFEDIEAGDRVTVRVANGTSLGKGGKIVQDYAERTGTVNPMLMWPDHVVLNMGGKHGSPQVCNKENFVKIARKSKSGKRAVPSWA